MLRLLSSAAMGAALLLSGPALADSLVEVDSEHVNADVPMPLFAVDASWPRLPENMILGQAPAFPRHEPKAQKEPVAARRGVVHVLCAAMISDVVVKHLNITGLDHVLIAQLFREIVDHVECFRLQCAETRNFRKALCLFDIGA